MSAESNPVRVIELWMVGGREIMERVGPLLAVIRGTVGTDPDLAAQWEVNEVQRRTANRALADLLAGRDALRRGLAVEDAADLAFLIVSAENYILATNTLGWTTERWQHTTAAQLIAALLDVRYLPSSLHIHQPEHALDD
ncbi:hypothetical protein [Nocardia mangyaensis]|uniref:hypothetical protein n=1 Tax=Nocardia mangyaensis TaxID=2213200 RepID=UPI00197CF39F|nr:hypothetical protein [Nocardia mangyaensis]